MRVLQAHKFFFPHAGAETVLFHTRALLERRGHRVIDFAMEHPDNLPSPYAAYFPPRREYNDADRGRVSRIVDAAASVYSPAARRQMRRLIEEARPDIAHLHLVYHQLTMSIVDELDAAGIPTVMTLHDYKIACPAHILFRDGHRCTLCIDGRPEHVVRHRCVKGSLPASVLAAAEARLVRARNSFDKVDVVIGPSRFAASVAVRTGLPSERVHAVPNFLPDDEIGQPIHEMAADARFFFAGRLEDVKGVRELLDVFSSPPGGSKLVLAGAGGDLEAEVIAAAHANPAVEYLGRLSRAEVLSELRRSRAALVPSIWDENYPMSLLEARACGIPVIATEVGGLPDMVSSGIDGYLVPPRDPGAIREAVASLTADRDGAHKMGQHGHQRLLRDNSEAAHYERLMGIFQQAQQVRASR